MSKESKREKRSMVVTIMGSEYRVRSDSDGEYVNRIAAYVDNKMREVARHGQTVDSLSVAVLAALNIASEYFQLLEGDGQEVSGKKSAKGTAQTEKQIERIIQLIDSVA